jgi:hypothetical protein
MEHDKVYPMTKHGQPGALRDAHVPAPHEGVGRALRGSYSGLSGTVPADMAQLLDRLR